MFERFTKPARAAVIQAQQCARETRSDQIRPEHVLIGVVDTASAPLADVLTSSGVTAAELREGLGRRDSGPLGTADADALKSIGIDLDAVRESVEASFGEDSMDQASADRGDFRKRGHIPFSKPGKKTLELSLREAIARGDKFIGSEHILLGLLRGSDPAVVTAITRHLSPAELRMRIVKELDAAA